MNDKNLGWLWWGYIGPCILFLLVITAAWAPRPYSLIAGICTFLGVMVYVLRSSLIIYHERKSKKFAGGSK